MVADHAGFRFRRRELLAGVRRSSGIRQLFLSYPACSYLVEYMLKTVFACLLAGILASPVATYAQAISGRAEVVDGDTLSFTGTRIRLLGVDAVEADQTCDREGTAWACGAQARARLKELVGDAEIVCLGTEHDTWGRLLASCTAGSIDLADAMVLSGFAIAYTDYSDAYVETEARARQFKLGIWSSSFETPAQWRASHPEQKPRIERLASREPGARVSGTSAFRDDLGRCAIKGNHSRKGEWIYHLPGQAYYNQTRPEALFCTEEAAQLAGYRRSKL